MRFELTENNRGRRRPMPLLRVAGGSLLLGMGVVALSGSGWVLKNPIDPNTPANTAVSGVFFENRNGCGTGWPVHEGTDITPKGPANHDRVYVSHEAVAAHIGDKIYFYFNSGGTTVWYRYLEMPLHPDSVSVGSSYTQVQAAAPIAYLTDRKHVHFELGAEGDEWMEGLLNPMRYGLETEPDALPPIIEDATYEKHPLCGTHQQVTCAVHDVTPNNTSLSWNGIWKVVLTYRGPDRDETEIKQLDSWSSIAGSTWNQKWENLYKQNPAVCTKGYYWSSYEAPPQGPYCRAFALNIAYYDNNGNSTLFETSITDVKRVISNLAVTSSARSVRVAWQAVSFDAGTRFRLLRSIDGGVSYPDTVGEIPYVSSQVEYVVDDETVAYAFNYTYSVWDSESRSLWGPATGGPYAMPEPPLPAGAPCARILNVTEDSVYVKIQEGCDWCSEYLVGHGPSLYSMGHIASCGGTGGWIRAAGTTGSVYSVYARGRNEVGIGANGYYDQARLLGAVPSVAVEGGAGEMLVGWEAVPGAAKYQIVCVDENTGAPRIKEVFGQTSAVVESLESGREYCAYVKAGDEFGKFGPFGADLACATPDGVSEVGEGSRPMPPGISVFPNPTSGVAVIRTREVIAGQCGIRVFDIVGRLIFEEKRWTDGSTTEEYVWRGTGADGRRCAAGMYFVLARHAGGETSRQKVLLTK